MKPLPTFLGFVLGAMLLIVIGAAPDPSVAHFPAIQTSNPTGGTASPMKIGLNGSVPRLDLNGTGYDLTTGGTNFWTLTTTNMRPFQTTNQLQIAATLLTNGVTSTPGITINNNSTSDSIRWLAAGVWRGALAFDGSIYAASKNYNVFGTYVALDTNYNTGVYYGANGDGRPAITDFGGNMPSRIDIGPSGATGLKLTPTATTLSFSNGNGTTNTMLTAGGIILTNSSTSTVTAAINAASGATADLQDWFIGGALKEKVDALGQSTWFDTYTSSTDYRGATWGWSGNAWRLSTTNAGTAGGTGGSIILAPLGVTAVTVATNRNVSVADQFSSPYFSVTGNGIDLSATFPYKWIGRSRIYSPADSIILLQNNAASDIDRLQFGGTTAGFPAEQRSATNLVDVLADASAKTTRQGAGYGSYGVATVTTSSTGATNTFTTQNILLYVTAATSAALTDNAGTTEFSGVTIAAFTPIRLQPGGKFTGTGVTYATGTSSHTE